MTPTTILLAALFLAGGARAADFMQTISGEAPLKSEQDQENCARTAEDSLQQLRAELEKQCQEDGGLLNLGLVTAETHAHSCTTQQIVTCTGTNSPASGRGGGQPAPPKAASAGKARPVVSTSEPGDHKERTPLDPKPQAKPKKARPAHLKKLGPPPADDDLAPKPQKPRKPKKRQPTTSPSNEVREVRAP